MPDNYETTSAILGHQPVVRTAEKSDNLTLGSRIESGGVTGPYGLYSCCLCIESVQYSLQLGLCIYSIHSADCGVCQRGRET